MGFQKIAPIFRNTAKGSKYIYEGRNAIYSVFDRFNEVRLEIAFQFL